MGSRFDDKPIIVETRYSNHENNSGGVLLSQPAQR